MDIAMLTWINTLALVGAAIVGLYEIRKISEALSGVAQAVARIEDTAARIAETLSRVERLSLAILERVSPPAGRA